MFIRIKKIKNSKGKIYPYAYLVENKWYKREVKKRGKGSRQRVVKYLGRVFSFSVKKDTSFFSFHKIQDSLQYSSSNNREKIIRDLIEWELYRHDVSFDNFDIDLKKFKIMKRKKEISLELNEGLMNSFSLKRLVSFKFSGEQREDAMKFAKYFVEAGIEVPSEIFVGFFGKVL